MTDPLQIDRLLREPEVAQLTGLSRTTRWRMERRGEFPRRHRISRNAVAWLLSDITKWIGERSAVGDANDESAEPKVA